MNPDRKKLEKDIYIISHCVRIFFQNKNFFFNFFFSLKINSSFFVKIFFPIEYTRQKERNIVRREQVSLIEEFVKLIWMDGTMRYVYCNCRSIYRNYTACSLFKLILLLLHQSRCQSDSPSFCQCICYDRSLHVLYIDLYLHKDKHISSISISINKHIALKSLFLYYICIIFVYVVCIQLYIIQILSGFIYYLFIYLYLYFMGIFIIIFIYFPRILHLMNFLCT